MSTKKRKIIPFLMLVIILSPLLVPALTEYSNKTKFKWKRNPPNERTKFYTIKYYEENDPDEILEIQIMVGDLVDQENPSYVIYDIPAGYWYFWLTATNERNESGPSDVAEKCLVVSTPPGGITITFEQTIKIE